MTGLTEAVQAGTITRPEATPVVSAVAAAAAVVKVAAVTQTLMTAAARQRAAQEALSSMAGLTVAAAAAVEMRTAARITVPRKRCYRKTLWAAGAVLCCAVLCCAVLCCAVLRHNNHHTVYVEHLDSAHLRMALAERFCTCVDSTGQHVSGQHAAMSCRPRRYLQAGAHGQQPTAVAEACKPAMGGATTSIELSASPTPESIVQSGNKRWRKPVDYARLAAEMFGENREGEVTEDDDWSPRAAGLQLTGHEDD